jgi:hypothetical protein
MSRNVTVTRTMFPHRNIHKLILISPDGKTHYEIDHIFKDRRRHSSILDVRSFRAADCVWQMLYEETGSDETDNAQCSYGGVQSQEMKRGSG